MNGANTNNSINTDSIFMESQAFYYVFCSLVDKCIFPFRDADKQKQFIKDHQLGKTPDLTAACITNGMLAVELSLKYLTYKETGQFRRKHEIDILFNDLPEKHKREITKIIKEDAYQNEETLSENLKGISNFFVEFRYLFEQKGIGFSGFLFKFVHIVCRYCYNHYYEEKGFRCSSEMD